MRSVILKLNKHKNNEKQWELMAVFNFISFDTVCGSKEHN